MKKEKNTASSGSNSDQSVTQTNSMAKDDQPISLVRKSEQMSIDLNNEQPVDMVKNIPPSQAKHENHMISLEQGGHGMRSIYHNPVTRPREQL